MGYKQSVNVFQKIYMKKSVTFILESEKVENWVLIFLNHLSTDYQISVINLTSPKLTKKQRIINISSSKIIAFEQRLSSTLKNNWYSLRETSSLLNDNSSEDGIIINLSNSEYPNSISLWSQDKRITLNNLNVICYYKRGVPITLFAASNNKKILSYRTSNNNFFLSSRKNNLVAAITDLLYYTITKNKSKNYHQVELPEKNSASFIRYAFSYVYNLVRIKFDAIKNNRKWHIGILGPDDKLKILKLPKGEFWADPFLIKTNEKLKIVFERMPENRKNGVITQYDLNSGNFNDILEEPFHLSFPYPFYKNGAQFFIPETKQNRSIKLYRMDVTGERLTYNSTLKENIETVDNAIFEHNNYLWLFTTIKTTPLSNSGDVLMIFYSDSLNSQWKEHELNPIKLDNSTARNAGTIFKENKKLFRPVQNCSYRYGGSVKLMEITKLTTNEFEEIENKEFQPKQFNKNAISLHTYSKHENYTCIDLLIKTSEIN